MEMAKIGWYLNMENQSTQLVGKAYHYLKAHRLEFKELSDDLHIRITDLLNYYYNSTQLNYAPFWIVRTLADRYDNEYLHNKMSDEAIKSFTTEINQNKYAIKPNSDTYNIIKKLILANPKLFVNVYYSIKKHS